MLGFQSYNNGGMAEYVRYPKNCVISRVPEEMSLEQALLIEPYGCSKHAVDRAQITNEDVVVISGAGTLGMGNDHLCTDEKPPSADCTGYAEKPSGKGKRVWGRSGIQSGRV